MIKKYIFSFWLRGESFEINPSRGESCGVDHHGVASMLVNAAVRVAVANLTAMVAELRYIFDAEFSVD